MMPFKKNLPAAGSGFSDYYVPEEKFLGPPSPKNLATPLETCAKEQTPVKRNTTCCDFK